MQSCISNYLIEAWRAYNRDETKIGTQTDKKFISIEMNNDEITTIIPRFVYNSNNSQLCNDPLSLITRENPWLGYRYTEEEYQRSPFQQTNAFPIVYY